MAWAEAEERLEMIEKAKLAKEIDSLCGSLFLDAIRKAHRASGVVLGITKPKAARSTKATPPVTEVLAEFRTALRDYVVLIEGHRLSGSTDVADRLLAPLADWKASRPTRKRAKQTAAPAPAPVPATT